MISHQSLEPIGSRKFDLAGSYPSERVVLNKTLCRLCDERSASLRQVGRGRDCHRTPDAVSERNDFGEPHCLQKTGYDVHRLIANEAQWQRPVASVRLSETEPVIGDHGPACNSRKLSWEVPPEIHAPERIMEQENCFISISGQFQRFPAFGKQVSPVGRDPGIAGC